MSKVNLMEYTLADIPIPDQVWFYKDTFVRITGIRYCSNTTPKGWLVSWYWLENDQKTVAFRPSYGKGPSNNCSATVALDRFLAKAHKI